MSPLIGIAVSAAAFIAALVFFVVTVVRSVERDRERAAQQRMNEYQSATTVGGSFDPVLDETVFASAPQVASSQPESVASCPQPPSAAVDETPVIATSAATATGCAVEYVAPWVVDQEALERLAPGARSGRVVPPWVDLLPEVHLGNEASEPEPEPSPEPKPEPEPQPEPEPEPTPAPVPEPEPAPEPTPAPVPEPAPVLRPQVVVHLSDRLESLPSRHGAEAPFVGADHPRGREQASDLQLAAPVEMWFGDARVGVRAGSATHEHFMRYAQNLLRDLHASRQTSR